MLVLQTTPRQMRPPKAILRQMRRRRHEMQLRQDPDQMGRPAQQRLTRRQSTVLISQLTARFRRV